MTDKINWGEDEGLSEAWWRDSGKTVNATDSQIKFAACFHQGMTATGAARAAGYSGNEDSIRQAGHRASRSIAVTALLSMAHAQTGVGPTGNVDMDEAKGILSRLARNSDATTRIRALETLVRIHEREQAAELERPRDVDIHAELREIEAISPDLARAYAVSKKIPWKATNE